MRGLEVIPQHMRGAMERYMEKGIHPGNFLYQLLVGNLARATAAADHINRRSLLAYGEFLWNHANPDSYGSVDKVEAWMKARQKAWIHYLERQELLQARERTRAQADRDTEAAEAVAPHEPRPDHDESHDQPDPDTLDDLIREDEA